MSSIKKYTLSLLVLLFLFPFKSHAQVSTSLTPFFGGIINKVTYCTCYYDPAVILEIKDYSKTPSQTIKVKYSLWFSKLRENYNIWEQNIYVIGGYRSGRASCKDTSGYYCKDSSTSGDDGTIDYIRGIGTGLTPSMTTSVGL